METRATARNQGTENVQHRFEVCIDKTEGDGHPIYRGYASKQAALDYACEYTGGTFRFGEADRETGRGRDMGKPTVVFRIFPDGQRVPWHKITRKARGEVTIKDTAEFKQEQKDQAQRNIVAQEKAQQTAATTFQTRENDMTKVAQAIGAGIGDKLGELIEELKGVQADGDKPATEPQAKPD